MATPRSAFICVRCANSLRGQAKNRTRTFASISHTRKPTSVKSAPSEEHLPRWKQTPPAMKMPIRLRPLPPNQPRWSVNEKDEPVDQMYDRFIGERAGEGARGQEGMGGKGIRGSELLDEEVKWLALTHKSFSHGSQGFNDRLAYLGKRILDLQTSLALLNSTPLPSSIPSLSPSSQSHTATHPSLHGLENITPFARTQALSKTRLARLAYTYGMDKVVRWKPKKADRLQGSGVESVLAQAVYAVIGALALQRGGEVAGRVARERVLGPLGMKV